MTGCLTLKYSPSILEWLIQIIFWDLCGFKVVLLMTLHGQSDDSLNLREDSQKLWSTRKNQKNVLQRPLVYYKLRTSKVTCNREEQPSMGMRWTERAIPVCTFKFCQQSSFSKNNFTYELFFFYYQWIWWLFSRIIGSSTGLRKVFSLFILSNKFTSTYDKKQQVVRNKKQMCYLSSSYMCGIKKREIGGRLCIGERLSWFTCVLSFKVTLKQIL